MIRSLPALLLGLSTSAVAQDLEDRNVSLEDDAKLQTHFELESEWHEFDDLDLRPLDESSDQAILDSDDRLGFAFTGFFGDIGYQIDDRTRFRFGAAHRGLWGADSLGGTSAFGGWIYMTALAVEFTTGHSDASPTFTVGRQFFEIGGTPAREYVFLDIVDAVRVDVPLGTVGTAVLLPAEVPGLVGSENDLDSTMLGYISQSELETYGFRGDRKTTRHGGMLVLDGLVDGLDARLYGFYTDIGAATADGRVGTGADISYDGRLGNFTDNDWVANYGVRASYDLGLVIPFGSFDGSTGIDRKELVLQDVDTTGFAWQLGAALDTRAKDEDGRRSGEGIRAIVSYFDAFGPAYGPNGLMYSHGYVGMKGQHLGGSLFNRYMGWHPTAYVGLFGVYDAPHDIARKSGTRAVEVTAAYDGLGPFSIEAGWTFAQDTGVTWLNQSTAKEVQRPYGVSYAEFAAQARHGAVLGQQVDVRLSARATEHVQAFVHGGAFLPGPYYAIEIDRLGNDTALGYAPGPRTAWTINGGTSVRF